MYIDLERTPRTIRSVHLTVWDPGDEPPEERYCTSTFLREYENRGVGSHYERRFKEGDKFEMSFELMPVGALASLPLRRARYYTVMIREGGKFTVNIGRTKLFVENAVKVRELLERPPEEIFK